jgi:hypothetical protein
MKIELHTGMHKKHIEQIAEYVREHDKEMKKLVDLALADDMTTSMKASWILSTASVQQKGCMNKYVDHVIDNLIDVKVSGSRRELMKALLHSDFLESEKLGKLVDTLMHFIRRTHEDLAVSYNALKLMIKICKKFPELKPELEETIRQNIEQGSDTWRKLAITTLRS